MEVAFFDFCGTLVKINTLGMFVDFTISDRRVGLQKLRKILFNSRRILSKLKICSSRTIEIKCLSGISEEILEDIAKYFYHNVIIKNFNDDLIKKVYNLRDYGFKVIIMSGALNIYLKYLPEDLPVDFIVSTDLKFNKNKCSGEVLGVDTIGMGKLKKLEAVYEDYNSIDFKKSYFFTDNLSDKPILKIVGNPFFINEK
jgi:HAD superfamily hydrolase (TIGR01490 family)